MIPSTIVFSHYLVESYGGIYTEKLINIPYRRNSRDLNEVRIDLSAKINKVNLKQ